MPTTSAARVRMVAMQTSSAGFDWKEDMVAREKRARERRILMEGRIYILMRDVDNI